MDRPHLSCTLYLATLLITPSPPPYPGTDVPDADDSIIDFENLDFDIEISDFDIDIPYETPEEQDAEIEALFLDDLFARHTRPTSTHLANADSSADPGATVSRLSFFFISVRLLTPSRWTARMKSM